MSTVDRRPVDRRPVDRRTVVARHRVTVDHVEPTSPLSVGNGEVCWTVDVTGLQTFPEQYPVQDPAGGPDGTLLGTQAQWGWHRSPPPDGADLTLPRRTYATPRGPVPYVDSAPLLGSDDSALDPVTSWLRANPHRLDLVRVGLVLCGAPDSDATDGDPGEHAAGAVRAPVVADLGRHHQELDLWTGLITSTSVLDGTAVDVTTACHPTRDVLAVQVRSGRPGGVAVRLTFPYGSNSWSNAADWSRPEDHRTTVLPTDRGARVARALLSHAPDGGAPVMAPAYVVDLVTGPGTTVRAAGAHEVLVRTQTRELDLTIELRPAGTAHSGEPVTVAEVLAATSDHWPTFWSQGAALDLSGTPDPRAAELERRVVLSQYLTAIQCSGSLPPQETGLTCSSWRGRFHLEMHWWHAAHFPLWGRPELLEPSMQWYLGALPAARRTAREQGYAGARWPKQVGPDARESPSDIGPFLLWQQPHVIHLAELLRRAGTPDALERYGELVEATAQFMADVAEPTAQGYGLGPPLVPAQESYTRVRDRAVNPPFELAYWSWALQVAQEWRRRAGRPAEPVWDTVAHGMVRPLVRAGRYEAIGVDPFTVRTDHPSMVYGYGVVPPTPVMDPDVVRATLEGVLADWDWASTWGWDYPALAMTATRLGDPGTAVDILLRDTPKNRHLPNGHNRQTDHLPVYLPGNGGLLAAVALMVGGWEGGPPVPGLPADWVVRHEGFVPAP